MEKIINKKDKAFIDSEIKKLRKYAKLHGG